MKNKTTSLRFWKFKYGIRIGLKWNRIPVALLFVFFSSVFLLILILLPFLFAAHQSQNTEIHRLNLKNDFVEKLITK
ncbi:MAG TPA: hypothetical protein VJ873_00970, partial [bacterium]|nr:hypothetical protein [bacterium]